MNFNLKKKSITRVALLVSLLVIITLLLTGCGQGSLPIGWAGVTEKSGVLYTASTEGRLVSVNTSNNQIQWAEPLKAAATGSSCYSTSGGGACGGAPPSVAIYGSPALFNDLVFIAGYNGKVYAYNSGTLQQRWVYPREDFLKPIISSVVVADSTIYFGCTDNKVYALDAATGDFKWEYATGGEVWSSPVVDSGTLFVSSFDNKLYALDAATGQFKWEFATEATCVSTPIVVNGVVYIGSLDRNLYAVNAGDGSLKWKFLGGNWFWARPVAHDGVIYAPCLDNIVYGLDANTGANVVSYNVGSDVSSWPVVVNDDVVVANVGGQLYALSTQDRNGAMRRLAEIPVDVNSPLAAAGNMVYINAPNSSIYQVNAVTGESLTPISIKRPE